MSRVAFKQCDVERAVAAAQKRGLPVTSVSVDPATGVITVLTAPTAEKPMSATERWRADRDAKREIARR